MDNLKEIRSKFEKDGYIWIKNFFDTDQIKNFFKCCDDKFHIEAINSSPEITSNSNLQNFFDNDKLINILNNLTDKNLTYFGGGNIVGHKSDGSNTIKWRRMHTDTRGHDTNPNGKTYYDPAKKKWPVLDVYIYLEDFENQSGCLKIARGSHKKFLPTLGNFIKVIFNISKNYKFDGTYSFKSIPFLYLFNLKNLKTKPGDLVIFNHAIHHSPNSLILKKFPNLCLPVFLENFLEKYFPNLFLKKSLKRRIISLCFGEKSKELDNFIKSRVQYLNREYFDNSKFFNDPAFREYLNKKNIECDTTLKTLIK